MPTTVTRQQVEIIREVLRRARKQVEDVEARATPLPAALGQRITYSKLVGEVEIVGARCTPPGGDVTVRLVPGDAGKALYIVGNLITGRYWLLENPRDVDAWGEGEILALYCEACLGPDMLSTTVDLDQLPVWLREFVLTGSLPAGSNDEGLEKWLALHKWN